MYFATDDDVLVNISDKTNKYVRIFDKNGYIVQPKNN